MMIPEQYVTQVWVGDVRHLTRRPLQVDDSTLCGLKPHQGETGNVRPPDCATCVQIAFGPKPSAD